MSNDWKMAAAKAKFSSLVKRAREQPQFIENRGQTVAVVVGIEQYQRRVAAEEANKGWQAFLDLSESLRHEGGETLELPKREGRASPFEPRRGRGKSS